MSHVCSICASDITRTSDFTIGNQNGRQLLHSLRMTAVFGYLNVLWLPAGNLWLFY